MSNWRGSRRWPLVAALLQPGLPWAAEPAAEGPSANDPRASAPAPAADPRSREQIFRDVFRRPAPTAGISGYVLVAIDGARPEKLPAEIVADERRLRVDSRALLAVLAQRLKPEVAQALERAIDPQGWLDRPALEAAGIGTEYDPRQFTLRLSIDPRLRGRSVAYLAGAPPSGADAVRPAPLSGFVNLNAKASHRDEAFAGFRRQRSDLTVAGDGALNMNGMVLEGSGYARTGDRFQRGDARLVVDRPEDALRFSAGDLRYPVVGYQTIIEMGGVGVSRDFSLQPYLRNYQSGQFEFYLERPAEVRIWVNESLVNTLQLPAGLHDIRGLSPALGLNSTRLVITDLSGRVQTLDFSFLYSPLLLDAGSNVFSLNAGVRRTTRDGRYRYDTGQPVLSASYLAGVRQDLTLGGYVQSDRDRTVVGGHATHALAASTLEVDAALRRTAGERPGLGARFDWIYLGTPQQGPHVQGQLGLEFLGAGFDTANVLLPSRRDRINFFGSLAIPAGPGASVRVTALYTPARDAFRRDAHNFSVGWTRRAGRFTFGLGLRERRTAGGDADRGVFFGLAYSFADGGNSFHVAKELESDAVTASWNSSRPALQAGPYGFASGRIGHGTRDYTAGAGYWTHQGLVEASQGRSRVEQDGARFDLQETAVRMQTALVFAGNAVGLVPSVSENFAIVRGKEGLAGIGMKLDPDGRGGSRGTSTAISPAVVGDLASYQFRELRIEPQDPPVGAAPDRLVYTLGAGYKSGILLELGKEARVIAVGRLVDARGQGLPHQQLEVRRLGDAGAEPLRTFTGRTGTFQLPDVRPGRYEITPIGSTPWNAVILDIAPSSEGLFRLGDIAVGR